MSEHGESRSVTVISTPEGVCIKGVPEAIEAALRQRDDLPPLRGAAHTAAKALQSAEPPIEAPANGQIKTGKFRPGTEQAHEMRPAPARLLEYDRPARIMRRHRAGALLASIALSGVVAMPAGMASSSLSGAEGAAKSTYQTARHHTPVCPPVSPAALKEAQHLLAEPQNPFINSAEQQAARIPAAILDTKRQFIFATTAGDRAEAQIRSKVASSLGLTVHNPVPDDMKLNWDLYYSPKSPFSVYFDAARSFLAEYGVTLTLGTSGPHYAGQFDKGSVHLADTNISKQNMINLIDAFGEQPVEYVQLISLKHIILDPDLQYDGVAITGDSHDTIVENPNDTISLATTWHEEGHVADTVDCYSPAGAGNDPSFTRLNGKTGYYSNSNPPQEMTDTSFVTSQTQLEGNEDKSLVAGYYEQVCLDNTSINRQGRDVVFSDSYAGTDPVEDKAQIFSLIPEASAYRQVLDPTVPRLKAKFTYIFAELYQHRQTLARFFAAVSRRPMVLNTHPFIESYCAPNATRLQKAAAIRAQMALLWRSPRRTHSTANSGW